MIKLNDELVKYANKKNLSIIVTLFMESCGWGTPPQKSLRVETTKIMEKPKFYREHEYEGVKIFIHKGLETKYNAEIIMKKKILLLPPVFKCNGFY